MHNRRPSRTCWRPHSALDAFFCPVPSPLRDVLDRLDWPARATTLACAVSNASAGGIFSARKDVRNGAAAGNRTNLSNDSPLNPGAVYILARFNAPSSRPAKIVAPSPRRSHHGDVQQCLPRATEHRQPRVRTRARDLVI